MITTAKIYDGPIVTRLLSSPKYFLESLVEVVDKKRRTVPFILNPIQRTYYKNRTNHDIILKPRQLGFSTLIVGLFLHDTMYTPNTDSVIVAHTVEASMSLFAKALSMFNSIPEEFRPHIKYRNRKELYFDLINSSFYVGSAETKDFGRGRTIQNLHCSECSSPSWIPDFMDGILESVPESGRVIMESTARGEGGLYYDYYFGAKERLNEFRQHYYRWFDHKEYRTPIPPELVETFEYDNLDLEERNLVDHYHLVPEQLYWRRLKKQRLRAKFIQEYPELDDIDAFLKSGTAIFDVEMLRNRNNELPKTYQKPDQMWLGGNLYIYKIAEKGARYIVGVDTSEGDVNSDYTAGMVIKVWPLPVEQVCLLHGRWTPDIASEKVWKVATAYNQALIAVERNNHGHAMLLNLTNGIVRKGVVAYPAYSNLYCGPDRKLGFNTGPLSKPQIIDELDRVMRSEELVINSPQFIDEARKFVSLKAGTKMGMGVPQGVGHDDIVMAVALAVNAVGSGKVDWGFV